MLETLVLVTPLPRDTIRDTIPLYGSDKYCPAADSNEVLTACDGTTSGVEPHIVWTIDPISKCLIYSGIAIGTDELCIKVCDTITKVCKETTVYITVVPPSDTLPVKDSIVTCKLITPADSNVVITSCSGQTRDTTVLGSWSIDANGCIKYVSGPTIGNDTLCIVKCDTVLNKCDTIPFIITITPRVDTIRDTNYINRRWIWCTSEYNYC